MKQHNIEQGTQGWHDLRSIVDGTASEAAVMLGLSIHTPRTELLEAKATGASKAVTPSMQALFDKGHAAEAAARPIIERLIGEDLYPVVGTIEIDGLTLLASFDGLTMDESIVMENKLLNKDLVGAIATDSLPDYIWPQLEQQLLVSGAEYVLFSCSDGTEANTYTCKYYSRPERRKFLIDGWKQFKIDLKNYQHVEVIPAAVAAPTKDLPALSIQVNGAISLISNLDKFGAQLNEFVSQIDKEPTDDQGFADAEAAIKTLQKAQDALEVAEANALAQTLDIDEMRKTVKLYADTARTTRLILEKMVKARKESIRLEIIQCGRDKLAEHIATLNQRIGKPYMPAIDVDFAAAVKGKRTIASIREAVGTAMLHATLKASEAADKIEINLKSLRERATGYEFLFSDTHQLVMKASDDLILTIMSRIGDHREAEAEKQEAMRLKIQAEEEAKAQAKAEAERQAQLVAVQEAPIAVEKKAIEVVDTRSEPISLSVVRDVQSRTVAHDYSVTLRFTSTLNHDSVRALMSGSLKNELSVQEISIIEGTQNMTARGNV